MAKNISRKDFLKGAAMSAAGVGLFASGLMNAAAEEEKPEYKNSSNWVLASQNVKWDEEHDIVIAGYGMAGTAAYIEAVEIDPNVDVVIYDKSDEENAGGQAIASGQCVIFVQKDDIETFRTYMRNLNKPQVIPEEDFNWLTNEFATTWSGFRAPWSRWATKSVIPAAARCAGAPCWSNSRSWKARISSARRVTSARKTAAFRLKTAAAGTVLPRRLSIAARSRITAIRWSASCRIPSPSASTASA
ncbi:MAG: hypothetical protein ACLUMK_14380 [Christensenellales bacterium]